MREIERRYTVTEFEVRSAGGATTIEGHAAVFNKLSQNLGGFVERVQPGAFTKTIKEADVRALFNHDPNQVLGRNVAGTLDLSEDSTGLLYRVTLGSRSYEQDLAESMSRGDVSQSSFSFDVPIDGDSWDFSDQGVALRTLHEVRLYDVSPVTYPAYLDADSGLAKRATRRLFESRGVDFDSSVDLRSLIKAEPTVPPLPTEPGAPTREERSYAAEMAALEAKRL